MPIPSNWTIDINNLDDFVSILEDLEDNYANLENNNAHDKDTDDVKEREGEADWSEYGKVHGSIAGENVGVGVVFIFCTDEIIAVLNLPWPPQDFCSVGVSAVCKVLCYDTLVALQYCEL